MSADKMPPLPFPAYVHRAWSGELIETSEMFTAEQVHTYARAYAAEQVRELVEALAVVLLECEDGLLEPTRRKARAAIAKHKGAA